MRTQSPDSSPEAERALIERIRRAPLSRRFRLVQSLSQRMLSGRAPEQDSQTEAIHTITSGYGQRIGQRVRAALAARPQWQEQPVDLTATLLPVMQALHEGGISSYIGGSIASSIHGMHQSASDIDLVLIWQGHLHQTGSREPHTSPGTGPHIEAPVKAYAAKISSKSPQAMARMHTLDLF